MVDKNKPLLLCYVQNTEVYRDSSVSLMHRKVHYILYITDVRYEPYQNVPLGTKSTYEDMELFRNLWTVCTSVQAVLSEFFFFVVKSRQNVFLFLHTEDTKVRVNECRIRI